MSYVVYKYFLPLCRLQFRTLNKIFHREKVFNFHQVQFIKLSLLFLSCLIALLSTFPHLFSFSERIITHYSINVLLSLCGLFERRPTRLWPLRTLPPGLERPGQGWSGLLRWTLSVLPVAFARATGKVVSPFSTGTDAV